jgi:hypothetical protein
LENQSTTGGASWEPTWAVAPPAKGAIFWSVARKYAFNPPEKRFHPALARNVFLVKNLYSTRPSSGGFCCAAACSSSPAEAALSRPLGHGVQIMSRFPLEELLRQWANSGKSSRPCDRSRATRFGCSPHRRVFADKELADPSQEINRSIAVAPLDEMREGERRESVRRDEERYPCATVLESGRGAAGGGWRPSTRSSCRTTLATSAARRQEALP